jgi:hypothetical protein
MEKTTYMVDGRSVISYGQTATWTFGLIKKLAMTLIYGLISRFTPVANFF